MIGGKATAGEFVCITVRDSGSGMTPEVKQHAGEPFFTTKGPAKGTGLGLCSVSRFVSATGGFMKIDSIWDVGTEVALFLPRATGRATMSDAPHSSSREIPLGDGELVLLVDDDERVLEATHKLLEGLGYAVINASNGVDAMKRLQDEEPVRVVLSDIVMSGQMSGFDVARQVRCEHPNVKILLYSGHHHEYSGLQGGKQILRKPFSRGEIARALSAVLHGGSRGSAESLIGCT